MKTGHIVLLGIGAAALAGGLYYFLVYKKNEPIKAAAKTIAMDNKYARKRAEDAIKQELKKIKEQTYQGKKPDAIFSEDELLTMATDAANKTINPVAAGSGGGGESKSKPGSKMQAGLAGKFNFKTKNA